MPETRTAARRKALLHTPQGTARCASTTRARRCKCRKESEAFRKLDEWGENPRELVTVKL